MARGHSTLDQNTPVPGMESCPPALSPPPTGCACGANFPRQAFSATCNIRSAGSKNMVETLVLRVRDPKESDADFD